MPSMYAIRARNPCDCAECVQIVALPSRFTSATARNGPIGACRTYPCSYVAETYFVAFCSAAIVEAAFPLLSPGFSHLYWRIAFPTFSLPGKPDHSDHFVVPATLSAACTASHSLGETAATRFPFWVTSAFGNCFLSIAPAAMSVDPRVADRTIRACSIPGSVRSQLHCVFPVILSGMCPAGNDVPRTLNSFAVFIGGSPVTVSPSSEVIPTQPAGSGFASEPLTGIFNSRCCPCTNSP